MKARDSFESRHMERLSARVTVQTAARHELTRADAFSLLGHVITKQRCETQSVNTVCNETVRRFSIYTAPLFTMDLL